MSKKIKFNAENLEQKAPGVLFIFEQDNEIVVTQKMLTWKFENKTNQVQSHTIEILEPSFIVENFALEKDVNKMQQTSDDITSQEHKMKLRRLSTSLSKHSDSFWTLKEYKEFVASEFEENKNKVVVKTTISPFVFDSKDRTYKQPTTSGWERVKHQPLRNIGLIFRSMMKSFFTSGTGIWYLAIITLISVLLINNLWNIRTVDFGVRINSNYYFNQPIFYTNYSSFISIYITPFITITTIFLPAYIVSMRSNSTFKRFGLYGISKEQLNIGITLTSLVLVIGSSLIINGPITYLGKLFASWIVGGQYEINMLFPFDLTPNYRLLYFFLILGTITFVQGSIFIGNKLNQTRSAIFVGIAFIFLASFTMYQSGGLPKEPDFAPEGTLLVVYNVFRWLFLISPYTIFLQAISLTAHDPGIIYSVTGFTLENLISFAISNSASALIAPPYGIILNNQDWLNWMPILCGALAIGFGIVPMITSDRWMKFGGIR